MIRSRVSGSSGSTGVRGSGERRVKCGQEVGRDDYRVKRTGIESVGIWWTGTTQLYYIYIYILDIIPLRHRFSPRSPSACSRKWKTNTTLHNTAVQQSDYGEDENSNMADHAACFGTGQKKIQLSPRGLPQRDAFFLPLREACFLYILYIQYVKKKISFPVGILSIVQTQKEEVRQHNFRPPRGVYYVQNKRKKMPFLRQKNIILKQMYRSFD